MKKYFLTVSILSSLALSLGATTPLWLRNVAISPDGSTVAFTYKGDIYTIPSTGGTAHQLTTNKALDTAPVWSPDSKSIAFSSSREGSYDIYLVDAKGGTPRRLTTHSGTEKPLTFLNDSVLAFSAGIAPGQAAIQGPFQSQTYTVNVKQPSARPTMLFSLPVQSLSINSDGKMLYQDRKGYEDPLRKHERSSGTSDIWVIDEGRFTKLTDFNGHDQAAVWNRAKSGDNFFFISEEDGTLNIYERSLDGKMKKRLTNFSTHPVRSLSAADNGTLAFSWDGEIYLLPADASEPRKLDVAIVADDYDSDRVKYYASSGISNIVPSPSGNEVAFVLRGDIYVTNTKYKTTKRITNTSAQERNVSFSPDGRKLVYDSDRDGVWQLFTAAIKNPEEKEFAYATDIVEEPLYKCETSAQQPEFSPDGKKVAFLENRTELRVIDLDSKRVNTALDGKYNYSYTDGDVPFEWSPDSRWLLVSYIGIGGWNNSDIAIAAADGSEVIDLTESGYVDNSAQWALDGKAITYSSGKYGMRSHGSWGNQEDIFIMFLDNEAWDNFSNTEEDDELLAKSNEKADEEKAAADDKKASKKGKKDKKDETDKDKVKPLEFDLDHRKYHTARLTPASASIGSYYLDKKGNKLYYQAVAPNGDVNLMVRDLKKNETRVLTPKVRGGFVADNKGENLFGFDGAGGIQKIAIPSGDVEGVPFVAIYERKPSTEREYIYDHMWKQVKDKFYDRNLHGVDWDGYGEHYRKFLPHINNNVDFAEMLSEILGELNASHTGARSGIGGASLPTASFGAFFNPDYKGDGLMVSELLPRSPLATKKAAVKPGDVILSIDGKAIEEGKDYYPLLEGLAGRKVRLAVRRGDTGKTDDVTVKLISTGQESELLYQRWVDRNQAIVDSVSGGRLAYVHVRGMDSPSFRTVYDQLLGKYRNREAVIVDTRYNGGGWLHNDIAQLLSGKEYVRFTPRGRYIGSEPFSQWTKPSVMLVNESNYSDAHGTPFTYQALGIGDVVGAPIPGTMTAVWWETQIDPSIVFGIPQVTSQDMNGTVLENHQLNPDVIIYNNPGDVIKGNDAQLIGSVHHLLKKLDSRK